MLDETNIRKQYQEDEENFRKIKDEVFSTLQNVAKAFYQKTRFRVYIPDPRLKPIDAVLSKMKRKGIVSGSLFTRDDDKISLAVNDFIGARILCNTREDVTEIEQLIQQVPRFKLIKREPLDKQNGYRALHLDLLYQIHWKDELIFVPIELQIKTHLQNAWAEVTHDESYNPENEEFKNEWEKEYSKHMADMLDTLDNMASTIRLQRLTFVKPPTPYDIRDSDTIINPKTLSYKIDLLKKGERLTQQEMVLSIGRLKEEGFETIAEVVDLLSDHTIQVAIKSFKEVLRNNENVKPFEMLYYGSLMRRGKETRFKQEMTKDYGFVQHPCLDCNRFLSQEEFDFIKQKTDADVEYYCSDHRLSHFIHNCPKCGLLSSGELCKNCAAKESGF